MPLTFYRISPKRGRLLAQVKCIVVHDHWKPYYTLKGVLQPLRLATDAEASFIHVFDRRCCYMVTHGVGKDREALGAVLADLRDGRGHQMHTEQISHQRSQALLGQQLVMQQIDHKGSDPLVVLHRCGNTFGEGSPQRWHERPGGTRSARTPGVRAWRSPTFSEVTR